MGVFDNVRPVTGDYIALAYQGGIKFSQSPAAILL